MKRSAIVCQVALLAVIGCSAKPGPVADTNADTDSAAVVQTESSDGDTATTFVSLKVPNMV